MIIEKNIKFLITSFTKCWSYVYVNFRSLEVNVTD